ncbi:hypothetical protein ERIC2_c24082 [Paenibacillus larvae subsp. larvae DSM 25430]|uniref:Uncharacterized protein n=1 Tax=Paenibacillus larvae subsp. larvae DSM 25430 TaxID=697284 RepID=V9W586_9BACL|nr:hypothetical protein ERIC2_c24082 [Paenibacillus larvae subsp. larvae DSM 25430]
MLRRVVHEYGNHFSPVYFIGYCFSDLFVLNKCGRNRITCLYGRLFLCKIKSP